MKKFAALISVAVLSAAAMAAPAHQINENVLLANIPRLSAIYEEMMRQLL